MANPMMMQPTILLLREGTDQSQGKSQIISNINACLAITETIKTTLGPLGMDKMVIEGKEKVTVSNDGATIMKLLDIVHPAAKTLVDISLSQDAEVGDGTTSVVVLAGELLRQAKGFVEDGVHVRNIINGYRKAAEMTRQTLKTLAVHVEEKDQQRSLLEKCAATALNSKLVASHREFFAKMVVDAVLKLDDDLNINLIGVKKKLEDHSRILFWLTELPSRKLSLTLDLNNKQRNSSSQRFSA
jgi:T-complex protein 1 subunit eta